MPTQNVNLHEHQSNFIHELTEGGRYKNASEVVRAGLRLLEEQEEEHTIKLERLRELIKEGMDDIERGDYISFENRSRLHCIRSNRCFNGPI